MFDRSLLELARKAGWRIILVGVLQILAYLGEIGILAGAAGLVYAGLARTSFLQPGLVFGISALLTLASGLAADWIQARVGERIRTDLRQQMLAKSFALGGERGHLSESGLTQLFAEGVENLDTYFSQYLPSAILALTSPFLILILSGIVNQPMMWILAGLTIVLLPLIPVSIILVSRRAKRVFGQYWNRYIRLGTRFSDTLRGLVELKDFDTAGRKRDQLNAETEQFRVATMKVLIMQLWSTCIMDLVTYGGSAGAVAASLALSLTDPTPASIALALFTILVALRFFLPLRRMGSLFHIAMNGTTAGRDILAYLKIEEPTWGEAVPTFTGLTLKGVGYTYRDDRTTQALHDIDLNLPATGLFGIVGVSGAGKSTLGKLLAGALRPSAGELSISGVNINSVSRSWFYENFSYLTSDPYLFPTSINQAFSAVCPGIDQVRIKELLKLVNLDYLIEEMRLDTPLKEDAQDLSGGERQRLALALAIANRRRVLIVDEAISAVDAQSEADILNALQALSNEMLVIVITHRLVELKQAVKVLAISEGTALGFAPLAELEAQGQLPAIGGEL